MWAGEGEPDAIIEKKGLRQISDEGAIEKIVDEAIAANPAIVAEYRAGKEKAFNSLVGKVMAPSKGKANPAQVNAILKRNAVGHLPPPFRHSLAPRPGRRLSSSRLWPQTAAVRIFERCRARHHAPSRAGTASPTCGPTASRCGAKATSRG